MNIQIERLMTHLTHLGGIGFKEGKGTTRMAYSPEYFLGAEYVKGLMEDAGLEVKTDAVGNMTGTWEGSSADEGMIACGSHLDSVPCGGIYDGTLGVLAAIECIRVMRESGYQPRHTLQVIAFEEEEGNVVGGTFGSRCAAGQPLEETVMESLPRFGMDEESVKSSQLDGSLYRGYLELHIEQGGILEKEQKHIGVVGGIVGITRYRATVDGFANHAGSTPMNLRDDAFEKTCHIVADLMDRVRSYNSTMVCTVGTISLQPGAVNVIPGRSEFVIELRDRTMEGMYQMADQLQKDYAESGLHLQQILDQRETPCDPTLQELVRNAADKLELSRLEMFSGAGHDMMNMGKIMPSALIFIPSKGGISHREEEYSSPQDIENGANVLLQTLLLLDQEVQK